jgi:hypothetical protein
MESTPFGGIAMRLPELSSFRPNRAFLLSLCLATGSVAAAGPASPGTADAPATSPPAPASCWTITGPFADGREAFFDAKNDCDTPRHCQVWVNGHQPSYMIHLEPGTSGRIDVGIAEPGDTYSQECTPIGLHAEQGA